MKHLIKDNTIIQSGIPSNFIRENGEGFYGGYENRTDIHHEDGWRDEIIPEYDNIKQNLGTMYYDAENDVVTYNVVNIPINLEERKNRLKSDLKNLGREFSLLITQARLNYETEPVELSELISNLRGLNSYATNEIDNLTEENVLSYILRGPQVNFILEQLNSFL